MAGRRNPRKIEPKFSGEPSSVAIAADERVTGGRKPTKGRGGRRKTKGAARPRRRRSVFRRILGGIFMLGVWVVIAVVGVVGYFASELPSSSEWRVPDRPPNIQIVANDGRVIANRGDTGGEAVKLSELPPYVPNAVIAVEDRRFRSHYGVDPVGLLRAVTKNVFAGGVVEGGSTITQQLAKNMFLTPERSLKRKVQEVILALWLERKYSKDRILEMYLNRVYFGSGAYGIEAAAHRYFNVDARDLTVGQAALIAGVLPAPSRYAPDKHPKAAQQRAAIVLADMASEGYITAQQAKDARDHPAAAATEHNDKSGNYIADWVMDMLPAYVGNVERDVVVETTVDLDLQDAAEHAVTDTLDAEGTKYDVGQGAMVVLDGTGAVRALVGGRSYADSQFDRAIDAHRQPGSAFKPFVYLTALEKLGYRPDTVMIDQPVTFGKWSPQNDDGEFRGPVTLLYALSHSINTVAAQLADQVTPQAVVQTAKRLGINSPLLAVPSIALGTSEVTLLELTGAYAPFSNGGYAVPPFVIKRVRSPEGDVLYDRTGITATRVISVESVAMMNYMLEATVEMGTGTRAALSGWPAAGKTGTSQNFRDAWFIGYTANLTAGVWVGNDSDKPTNRVFGGKLPAEIWEKFMTKAHQGVPVQQLPGADLIGFLMGQPPGGTPPGLGVTAQDQQTVNGQGAGNWPFGGNNATPPAEPPQPTKRRGFFARLFGG